MKNRHKILPKYAIKYSLILILSWALIFTFIDRAMPEYNLWQKEDYKINDNKRAKKRALGKTEYPLLKNNNFYLNKGDHINILVVGDSFIDGDGYSNINETWWRQLQLELYNRGYYDVNVYAVGHSGASTYDEMKWITETTMIDDLDPDLIIIGYVQNDPILTDKNNVEYIKRLPRKKYFNSNIVTEKINKIYPNITYKINNMLNQKREKMYESLGKSNNEIGYPYSELQDIIINEKWSKIYEKKAIEPLGKYLNSLNIPSFVVTTPRINVKTEKRYSILSAFEENNITTYNLYEDLKLKLEENPKYRDNFKINLVNSHPGTFYTKFYAEHVADILEEKYSNVLGTKYEEKIEYPIVINDQFPYYLSVKKIVDISDYTEYKISYIDYTDKLLYMPIKKPYLKLSLAFPVSISKIEIKSGNLRSSELYLTKIDEQLGYDTQKLNNYGRKKGKDVFYNIDNDDRITSINLHLSTLDNSQNYFTLKIYK